MNYSIIFKEALTTLGGFAVIVAALTWLSKSLVSQILARDIARFQSDLQSASERQLEAMRSEFHAMLHEHAVRFDYLHKRRAEFIATLYQQLSKAKFDASLWGKCKTYDANDPAVLNIYNDAINNWKALEECSSQNRLFLPKNLADRIDGIIASVVCPLFAIKATGKYQPDDDTANAMRERWQKVEKDVPGILDEIEIEFRKLLGTDK